MSVAEGKDYRTDPFGLTESKQKYPVCNELLQNKSVSGMRLDCNLLASELAAIWSASGEHRITATVVTDTIQRFVPICMAFSEQDSMRAVFESARAALNENVI